MSDTWRDDDIYVQSTAMCRSILWGSIDGGERRRGLTGAVSSLDGDGFATTRP